MAETSSVKTEILKTSLSNEVYQPSVDEMKFITEAYELFQQDRLLKNQGLDILNGQILQQIWDEADREYNIFFPEYEADGWRKKYSSLITQDKINKYWGDLYGGWIFPEITAVNKERKIDRVVSKVCRGLLEYAEKNDGRPTSSGFQKFIRQGHQKLKYGTCHTLHTVIDGDCTKEIVPNEEIFIPNYYEFDIQKQPHLIRLQQGILYETAQQIFGDLPNFKYVRPGRVMNWSLGNTPWFRNYDTGIVKDNEVQIIWIWKDIPKKDTRRGYKFDKYFNVLINGVLMFDYENRSPFRHGLYPITKSVADIFDANFYWGKPIYLRFKADKTAYDDFRSVILNRGVLNLLKPMVSMNGLHIDQDVIVPGKITATTDDINNLKPIPGIGDAIDNSSFQIMNFLKSNINDSIPQLQPTGKTTNYQVQVMSQEVNSFQNTLALFTAFDVEAGAYITLRNALQFYPRQKKGKLILTDQQLESGQRGDLNVQFQQIGEMTQMQELQQSEMLWQMEDEAKKSGEPMEMIIIDRPYINELDLFISIEANPVQRETKDQKQAKLLSKNELYANDPFINQEERARILVRGMGDNEEQLIKAPQPEAAGPEQSPQPGAEIPNTNAMQSARKQMNPLPQLRQ